MTDMKKLISALTALAVLIIAGVNFVSASSTSASETVTKIGENIRNHAASIQSENDKLLHTAPEVLAAADFSQYDTSNKLLGAKLFDFNEPSRIPYGDDIEDVINGRDNRIYTIGGGKYEVHTLKAAKGYPNVFANDLVLRSASGERAALNSAYAKDIPEYQVIKNLKNIYVENVDFNDFYSIKFEYCDNIIFNNCTFNNFTNNGLVFFGCTNVSVVNCSFVNCGNKMSDNTNGGYSIRVVGSKERPSSGILIENCNIDNSCGKAVSFTGSVDDYVVRNNKITKTVWGAIDYWSPDVSGKYVNVIENNVCTDIGFGVPSVNDAAAMTSRTRSSR